MEWVDSINSKISLYKEAKSSPTLFVHFDKTIYVQNENVWFTCYLLNRTRNDNPDILSIVMVNDVNKSVVLERKFQMADGISFGNIFLTDSIPPGNYSFLLYTNQLSHNAPVGMFIQRITLLNAANSKLRVSLNLDTTSINTDKRKVYLTVTREERPMPGAKISYLLGDKAHPLLSGEAKTDDQGHYLLILPSKLSGSNREILSAEVKLADEIQNVDIPVPFNRARFSVKFFPEGGYLIQATPCWVGLETKWDNGDPVATTGVLFKDDHPIDTITTDSYGMGRFKLLPLMGSSYALKLLNSKFNDSVFELPHILPKGPVINISRALTDDSLTLRLTSKYAETITVLVHNYRELFYAFSAQINGAGKNFIINLKPVPRGLATVTLLDSLHRPCAERMFFAHYDNSNPVIVQTDKPKYNKREKVTLTLKLALPDTGLISVACVESNRLLIKQSNDIESYTYLQNELGTLPLKEHYMGNSASDKSYLENILLIKGWRRYKWQAMMEATTGDTIRDEQKLGFTGTVTHFGRPLKKPIKIIVMTDSLTSTIATNKTGCFKLSEGLITTAENKKVRLLLLHKDIEDYKVDINDPFQKFNLSLIKDMPDDISNISTGVNQFVLKGLEHTVELKEVKIIARKDNNYSNTSAASLMPTENECGDYICMFGIFNCPNHKGFANNIIPKVGEYYVIRGRMTKYLGCNVPVIKNRDNLGTYFQGIKFSKEFYGSDYSAFNPSQPEFNSTLYWKHLSVISSAKPMQLSFYCSDITGLFKIVIQGVTKNDVTYGESYFSVQ